jgi:hypothetical protein
MKRRVDGLLAVIRGSGECGPRRAAIESDPVA